MTSSGGTDREASTVLHNLHTLAALASVKYSALVGVASHYATPTAEGAGEPAREKMSHFFRKKGGKPNAANVHMTEVGCRGHSARAIAYEWYATIFLHQAEAALAQSDFNIDKILEIQNKFTGGTVRKEAAVDVWAPGRVSTLLSARDTHCPTWCS